jgi:DNA polymerase lambda
MPRDEATAISKVVHDAAYELFGKDTIVIETCGSYRRGKQSCGDVDILMTRKDDKPINGMLEKLIVKLEKDNFLKERLGSTRVSDKGSEMYMGVCKLKDGKMARRIDIKVYPKDQYGFAILYFTGSDYFNRSMRLFAEKKGFTLSDHGLAPVAKSASKQKVGKGIGIPCLTEQ